MKKKIFIFVILVFLFSAIFGRSLKITKVILDNEKESIAYVKNLAISPNQQLYISDLKELSIRKYSKKGILLKKVGEKGEGPGYYLSISSIRYYDDYIYVYDDILRRVTKYSKNLELKNILKLENNKKFTLNFFVINNTFYGTKVRRSKRDKLIYVYDKKGKMINNFFNHFPLYYKKASNRVALLVLGFDCATILDYHKSKSEFIITYFSPASNNLELFTYSRRGSLKKKILLSLDEKYKFPKHRVKFPREKKFFYEYLIVIKIQYFNESQGLLHYKIVEMSNKGRNIKKSKLVLFKLNNGKIINTFNVKNEFHLLKIRNNLIYSSDYETLTVRKITTD